MGNKQRVGINYGEAFAPIEKLATVRSILVVAAVKGCSVQQMNVKNALFQGELEETVYMNLPRGYLGKGFRFKCDEKYGSESRCYSSNKLCKLPKSLYELKQSPRQSFAK